MPQPGHFNPVEEPWYPLQKRVDLVQGCSEQIQRRENLLPPSVLEPQTVQPVEGALALCPFVSHLCALPIKI